MDGFPVAINPLQWQPQPAPTFPLSPDPGTPGVTWYQDYAGTVYPGYGTYYDVVAANIDSILLVADNIDEIEQILDADYLLRAGGTMLGPLLLAGNPAQAMEAVPLQYLQANYLALAGGAMQGTVTLAGPPQNMNDAATKQYVDQYAGIGYSGTWQVAANNPDIKGGSTTAGQYYMAITVNPNVAETAPAGVPGISGKSIRNGDRIIWDNVTKVWQQVAAGTDFSVYDQRYLQLTGGTLTGQLSLPDPTGATNAVTVQYMAANALMLSGGTMTGPMTLAANASSALQPVTLQQMQAAVGSVPGGATISDTAPASPVIGQLWFDSVKLNTYCWYNDGNSTQWTPIASIQGGPYATPSYVDVGNASVAATAALNTGRNLIHNGQFNVAQRGTGPFTTTGTYCADRWMFYYGVDTNSFSIVTLTDADRAAIGDEAAQYALQDVLVGTASGGSNLAQRIEKVRRVSGKTITVSFWAKATSGTPRIGVSIVQSFGTGGSPSTSVTTGPNLLSPLSTTWTRFSTVFSVPSSTGKTLGSNGDDFAVLEINLSNSATAVGQQSGTIQIYGVQLEIGSGYGFPTPLAKRDPADELALCQRFYFASALLGINGWAGAAGQQFSSPVVFPATMRAVPTIGGFTTNGSTNVTGSASCPYASAVGTKLQVTNTSTGQFYWDGTFTASADL